MPDIRYIKSPLIEVERVLLAAIIDDDWTFLEHGGVLLIRW